MNDNEGASMLLDALPAAKELIADRGYDSDRFRTKLIERAIVAADHHESDGRHQTGW